MKNQLLDADLLTLTSHYDLTNFERNFTNALDDFKLSQYDMEELYESKMLKRYTPRPVNTNDCNSLENAKMFRFELIEDISRRVELIQDESLQEFQIREMNDKINELLVEKENWDQRIVELGGPNYARLEPSKIEITKDVITKQGYRYFGRARELSGVKTLLKAQSEFEQLQNDVLDIPVMPTDYYFNELDFELAVQYESKESRTIDKSLGNVFGIYPQDVLYFHSLPSDAEIEEVLVNLKKKEILDNL
eukprot:NODE_1111_length_1057_cov_0.172234.p1 type:complete len:249 gc:universal NODE_1111_length_1057_cov_0.172234:179-925(+)